MAGEGCFAIATDLRYGQELKTVTCDFPKAFEMAPNLWMGLTGLATDVQVLTKSNFVKLINWKPSMSEAPYLNVALSKIHAIVSIVTVEQTSKHNL